MDVYLECEIRIGTMEEDTAFILGAGQTPFEQKKFLP